MIRQRLPVLWRTRSHQQNLAKASLNQQTGLPEILGAMLACPHCAPRVVANGFVSGLQCYRCQSCRKTFNILTGTPLARLRHKPKWLACLVSLAGSMTGRMSAAEAGRHRFLANIGLDFPLPTKALPKRMKPICSESGIRASPGSVGAARANAAYPTNRSASVARDLSGNALDSVTGNGQLAKTRLSEAFGKRNLFQYR